MIGFEEYVKEAAQRTGVPANLLSAMIQAESGGNPRATSSKGAKGLLQLMDSTGQYLHKKGGYAGKYDPYDVKMNVNLAADYIKELAERYGGNWRDAAAAYNMGPTAYDKRGRQPYEETYQYVQSIDRKGGFNDLASQAIDKASGKAVDYGVEEASKAIGLDTLFSSGAGSSAVTPVGTAANGGLLMSDGSIGLAQMADGSIATIAPPGAPVSGWSLSGFGSAGNYYAPAVGAALAIDLFGNKRHGGRGALQGAASGAMIGSYFGPPGMLIGAGIGGLAGFFGNFGDADRWKEEQARYAKLRERGIRVPTMEADSLTRGRSKDELIAIERLKASKGLYSNEKFAASRDEKDLKYQDTWGAADWFERYGNDYLESFNEDQRRRLNELALSSGAVSEGRGQLKIDFSKLSDAAIEEILGRAKK